VFAAKVHGASHLHQLTIEENLDFFLLFSSAASVLGSPGQANYAAANASLDALAHYRRSLGLPALCLNWGPWAKVGLAARMNRVDGIAQGGLASLDPDQGIAIMDHVLRQGGRTQVAVLPADWTDLGRRFAALGATPFLTEVAQAPTATVPSTAKSLTAELDARALETMPQEQRREFLEDGLSRQLASILGSAGSRIDSDRSILKLGVDSLMAMELKNRIEKNLGVTVPTVQLLQGPSVSELTSLVLERLTESPPVVDLPLTIASEEEWETLKL